MKDNLASSIIKKMFWIIVILIITIIINNMVWIWYINQFDFVSDYETVELDTEGEGVNNYIGNDGDINNGENKNN